MSRDVSPVDTSSRYGQLLVVATVLASFAALYGLSLASDPETYGREAELSVSSPTEEEYLRVADPSHNNRIFALRNALQERGFQLNGGVRVNEDPLAAIRGVYGFVSPLDELQQIEWRLMATRCKTCQPTSFLRLSHSEDGLSLPLANCFITEWRKSEEWLPAEVIAAGERLATHVQTVWQLDRASQATTDSVDHGTAVLMCREWTTRAYHQQQYRLQLQELVGDYHLRLDLVDNLPCSGQAPSCELALHFRWLK